MAIFLGLVIGAIVVALIVGWWMWRNVRRDLRAVSERLPERDAAGVGETRMRSMLEQLDRMAEDARVSTVAAESDRDRLILAVQAVTDGVVLVDETGNVMLRNDAAVQFSGARHADALAEEAISVLLDRARFGETGERELQLFGPPRRVLRVRAVPLTSDGRLVGAVALVRDVSEARRVESVRRDFVANVSHELKTPIGALALLAETMGSSDDMVVIRRLADRVVREADRLGHIVDDLLNLSLIEAQEAPTREPVPIHLLVQEAVEQVRVAATARSIPIEFTIGRQPLTVVCDQRQVVSALTNLLDNAVKYSDPGRPVLVSTEADGSTASVVIRDQGVGIPSRDLERIFERFYRVDQARSRATGGTGLGLSIVRHVAQAHGGEVTVESREGEGSVFRLVLPMSGSRAENHIREAS